MHTVKSALSAELAKAVLLATSETENTSKPENTTTASLRKPDVVTPKPVHNTVEIQNWNAAVDIRNRAKRAIKTNRKRKGM